ncbi:hypothetical protein NC652_031751 [Populus alba x Populus x berolinensis]|nr:hypothetical protein NC652_031751 [Populus alba x Populus x berolinensis]
MVSLVSCHGEANIKLTGKSVMVVFYLGSNKNGSVGWSPYCLFLLAALVLVASVWMLDPWRIKNRSAKDDGKQKKPLLS